MPSYSLIALAALLALQLSACDTQVAPPDGGDAVLSAPGQFTATLNGEPYSAPSEYIESDSTFSLASVLVDQRSFYFQSIGVSSREVGLDQDRYTLSSTAEGGPEIASWADELDGDAVIHFYDLWPEEPATLTVTELNRTANRLRATLTATYVRDAPGQSVLSRWPDTLRIEGEFVSELVPTDTLRR